MTEENLLPSFAQGGSSVSDKIKKGILYSKN